MSPEKVFLREATGLVKNLSAFDALNLNVAMCSPLQGVLWAWTYGPAMFPGANLALSYLLGIVVVGVGPALTYALWTVAMPRSGGDYVWLSRSVHASYGFLISWFLTFVFLNWFALGAATVGPFFFGTLFLSLGMQGLANAVSSTMGAAILGTITVVLSTLMIAVGVRIYARVYRGLFLLTLCGTIIFIALLLSTSHQAFVSGFNQANPNISYDQVLAKARTVGWVGGWTVSATLFGLIFPFQNYGWAGFPGYISGEIKRVDKAAWTSILGGLVVMGAWYVITGTLLYSVVGQDFLHAMSFLYNNASASYPLSFAPYPQNYVFFMTNNQLIITAIAVTWLLAGIYVVPVNMFLATRNVFAWSFDRIVPTKLAQVSERFASPINTVVVCGIVSEILMLFAVAATYAVMVVNTFMIMEVVMCLIAAATIMVPFLRRDMFENFPPITKKKIIGVPLMTLSGLIMLIFSAFLVYAAYTAPALGGLNTISLAFNITVLLIALPIYFIAYRYNKSKGIDLTLQFKQVPPE
jgi:amino acid transporter